MNKAEAKLTMESIELSDAFIEAKKHRDKNPQAYEKAKKAMSEHRTYWRQIREAVAANMATPEEQVGSATARTKTATAKASRGG